VGQLDRFERVGTDEDYLDELAVGILNFFRRVGSDGSVGVLAECQRLDEPALLVVEAEQEVLDSLCHGHPRGHTAMAWTSTLFGSGMGSPSSTRPSRWKGIPSRMSCSSTPPSRPPYVV